MEEAVVDRKMLMILNPFRLIFGSKVIEKPISASKKEDQPFDSEDIEKALTVKDRKVLIEYYKNLGRGPL
jgi:hypothetical protein